VWEGGREGSQVAIDPALFLPHFHALLSPRPDLLLPKINRIELVVVFNHCTSGSTDPLNSMFRKDHYCLSASDLADTYR